MRKLEPVQPSLAGRSGPTWGSKQRIAAAGVVVWAIGAVLLAYFWITRPRPPDDATIRRIVQQKVESTPALGLLWMWQAIQTEGLQSGRDKEVRSFLEWRHRYNLAMAGAGLVMLAGGVVAVYALASARNAAANA